MTVTIGIKALNERAHIAQCLQSAVNAASPYGGRVVLADSGSTDGTVDIARQFPITIVQLANPADRCCGAGAQLAFQYAQGAYFYLLDGDMELDPAFLSQGIAYLEAHPDVAGVGGRVIECNVANAEFKIRAATVSQSGSWQPGPVDRLDCGGLYRISALRQVGYFADRNLHAFEEFELAARLQAQGWGLARIDCPAVRHYGHLTSGYRLLLRRLRTGYAGAPGEVLRGALGKAHLTIVLRRLGHIRNAAAVILWWCLLAALMLLGQWPALAIAIILPVAFLWFRRKSFDLALFSLASWNVTAIGLIIGLFRRRVAPQTPLPSHILSESVRG